MLILNNNCNSFNWLIAARASSYVALSSFIYVRAGNFYSLVFIFGSKTQPFSSLNMLESLGFPWSSRFTSGVDYNKLHGLGRPLQSCLCTSALACQGIFHFPLGRFPSIQFKLGGGLKPVYSIRNQPNEDRIQDRLNSLKKTQILGSKVFLNSNYRFYFLSFSKFPNIYISAKTCQRGYSLILAHKLYKTCHLRQLQPIFINFLMNFHFSLQKQNKNFSANIRLTSFRMVSYENKLYVIK